MRTAKTEGLKYRLAKKSDVPLGEGRRILLGPGREVALFHTREGFYAVENRCPHGQGPLADGFVAGSKVYCPLHNMAYDLKTGTPCGHKCPPVKAYDIYDDGLEIHLSVSEDEVLEEAPVKKSA